jgi:hypothetical protein
MKISLEIEDFADVLATPLFANNNASGVYEQGIYEGQRQTALNLLRKLYKFDPLQAQTLSNICLERKFKKNAEKSAGAG